MIVNIKNNERLLSLFFFSYLLLPAYSYAGNLPFQPYFIFDSFSYSETVSIESAIDGWEGGSFDSGERQWTWNWVEAGVQYKHWAIGLVQRYDYDVRFSEQTAELLWLVMNKKDLPIGKKYDLDLKTNAINSSGIRISFTDRLTDAFDYRFGLSYLQANYTLNGQIDGDATAISDTDYDYQGSVYYTYTEDHLFNRSVEEPTGKGFSFDFMFNYQVTPKLHWQLQVRDLLARLYWDYSPYTEGLVTSDRKEYDENGYVLIDPVLQGYEGITDTYVQTLQPRWYSKGSYEVSDDNVLIGQFRYQYGHALYALGIDHKLSHYARLGANYWPINQSIELNWNYHSVKLAIATDTLKVSDMKTFWLSFSYGV